MPSDGSCEEFHTLESGRNHSPPASSVPSWAALGAYSFLNVFAGFFILTYLAKSTSLVTGFTICLVFLGISYLGWFAAGVAFCQRNLVGLSLLAIASSVSAALCILMRVLLSSQAAIGFNAKAFQVVRDPFELARLGASSASLLTFLAFFYAATSAFLLLGFRRAWISPRLLAVALLPGGQMHRVLLRWLAINSLGVSLSFFLAQSRNGQIIAYGTAAFVATLVLLGGLQALASCWLISLVKAQNKALLVSLGFIVGLLTAFGALVLGMTFLYVYAAIGFWSFSLTGMLFGTMAGHSQWRWLVQSPKSP
jgi:hypothetical protein